MGGLTPLHICPRGFLFDPFTNNKVKNFWWTLFKDNIIYTTTFTQIIKLFRNIIKTFYTHSKSERDSFLHLSCLFGQIIFYCVCKLSSGIRQLLGNCTPLGYSRIYFWMTLMSGTGLKIQLVMKLWYQFDSKMVLE